MRRLTSTLKKKKMKRIKIKRMSALATCGKGGSKKGEAKPVFFPGSPKMSGNARKKRKVGGVSGGRRKGAQCAREEGG